MADVSSLGQYKVVVTADYSQLKSQFEAMTKLVQDTTKAMAESIDKSMGAMNTAMNTQLKSMVTSMQNAFSGADTTVKSFGESVTKAAGETAKAGETVRKGGEGFKTYAQQVREAEREVQKSYQTLQDLQNKLQIVRNTPAKTSSDYLYRQNEEQKIEATIRAQQAEYDRLRQKLDQLKATQEQYKNSVNQTAIAAKQAERALVQGAKDEQNLMRQNARLLEGEVRSRTQGEAQVNIVQQQTANAQSRRIAHLQTQYRVAYEEANKYLQTHAKMSEAVFIR
jgi:chromosome segregation ATPase